MDGKPDKDFFEKAMEKNPFFVFENKPEWKQPGPGPAPAPGEKVLLDEQSQTFLPFFFLELVQRVKNTLGFIKTFTHLSRDKLDNPEFKEYFSKIISEDIDEIDTVLNSLINYFKIITPIVKENTVHSILGEILKRHGGRFEEKKIKIIKKFEKNLPETTVHEEQLRYILNSVVEYAIPLILSGGSIGFLTKSFNIEKEPEEMKTPLLKEGRCVEIVVIFTGCRKSPEKLDGILGTTGKQKEEGVDLKLLLVREIMRKNQGILRFEVNEQKPRTFISMIFPVERRKIVNYQLTEP